MSFGEMFTWARALAWTAVTSFFVRGAASRLAAGTVSGAGFRTLVALAIATWIVLTVGGAVAAAVGKSVLAARHGRGSDARGLLRDERDARVANRGDVVAYRVVTSLGLALLVLILLEVPHAWLASLLFATLALGALAGDVARLVAYGRGP